MAVRGVLNSIWGELMKSSPRIQILLYTRQPFVGRGFAAVLRGRPGYKLLGYCESLSETRDRTRTDQPAIVLIHLESPIGLGDLRDILSADRRSHVVLWGDGLATEFAFQAMQLGVRGILPGTASVDCLLDSLANVNRGVLCFDKDLMDYLLSQKRVTLTERQGQLVSLVAQGLKNKEIAWRLGTTEGTVKAYLYKLFRKLGVNDRLGMVLYGQKNLFDGQPELQRTGNTGRHLRRTPAPFVPSSLPPQTGERARLQAVS